MLSRAFGVLLQEEGIDDVGNVLVLEKLPDAIACQNYYLILRCQSELLNFRYSIHSNPTRHRVTERSRHRQARYVLIFQPDTHWSDLIAQLISIRVYPAIICQDMLRFFWVVWLMISTQWFTCAT